MPDSYNPAVALGLHPPENSLAQTFNTIANLQQSQAHTGLYTLQAAQQQRQLTAQQAYAGEMRASGDSNKALQAYTVNGGDPSGLVHLITATGAQNELARGGGVNAAATREYAGAAEARAKTTEIGVNTQDTRYKMASRLAGGAASDPTSDQAWSEFVHAHSAAVNGTKLQEQAALRITDPNQRLQIARAHSFQGVSPDEANKLHNYSGSEGITTPLGEAQRNAPQSGARPTGGNAQGAILPPPIGQENSMYLARPDMPPGGQPPTQTVGRAPLPPSVVEEQKQRGEYLGKLPGKLTEDANAARQQSFTLEQMKNESATWDMGKGAETMMKAGQYLKPIAYLLGSTILDQPVADYETFKKNSGTLVRQAVKEVSSRAAVQEFNMIQKQLPEPGMSRQGFYGIADQFHSVNDFKVAKEQAGNAWGRPVAQGGHGTMEGFEADWNKNITPTAFLVHRMSPEQLHKTLDGLQDTAEGRATIASIKRQLRYANQSGLF